MFNKRYLRKYLFFSDILHIFALSKTKKKIMVEGLINNTLNEKELNAYVNKDEMPMRNTVATHPSITFRSTLHSILYETVKDRDADFQTIIKMY